MIYAKYENRKNICEVIFAINAAILFYCYTQGYSGYGISASVLFVFISTIMYFSYKKDMSTGLVRIGQLRVNLHQVAYYEINKKQQIVITTVEGTCVLDMIDKEGITEDKVDKFNNFIIRELDIAYKYMKP